MNTFSLTIVTPSGELFSTDQAQKVRVRTRSGEITVLAKHTPLVSVLEIGQMVITTSDDTYRLPFSAALLRSGRVVR